VSLFNVVKVCIGLGGVPPGEASSTNVVGTVFEWLTLCVALWLPVQWYLERQHILVPPASMVIDWVVWAVFTGEMLAMLVLVRRRIYYLCTNWMNVVIIIALFPYIWHRYPLMGSLRALRVFMALFLAAPWLSVSGKFLERTRIWMTLLVFIVVVLLGGLIITTFDSGISNPLQGIWWALVTVTTVGYGEVVPTTWLGKLFAAVVLCFGYLTFSLLTAHISSYFVGKRNKEDQEESRKAILDQMNASQQKIDELIGAVSELQEKLDEQRHKSDEGS
jgi:voltage-gated potassium channel